MFDLSKENEDFNQYWYSSKTIEAIVSEVVRINGKTAFLSTPSLYFSLPEEQQAKSSVFEYDRSWENDRGFVFYDFNKPEDVPAGLHQSFDVVVIDPPFITEDVWRKYAAAAKLLLKDGIDSNGEPAGKVILTTVLENEALLHELFGTTVTAYRPSIPHLVYQYNLFTNYGSPVFSKINPEID
eukprot:gene35223-42667_t